jgi:hypothetical protein
MGPRFARKMSYSHFDVLKIAVLVLIFAFLTYNAAGKFWITQLPDVQVRVNPDFRPCDALARCVTCPDKDVQSASCRAEVSKVFSDAERKCKGYVNNLQQCKNKRRGQCNVEEESANSCLSAVTSKVMTKWWTAANGGTT